MKRRYLGIIAVVAVSVFVASSGYAAELSKAHVTGIGLNANTVASYKDEVPFWTLRPRITWESRASR